MNHRVCRGPEAVTKIPSRTMGHEIWSTCKLIRLLNEEGKRTRKPATLEARSLAYSDRIHCRPAEVHRSTCNSIAAAKFLAVLVEVLQWWQYWHSWDTQHQHYAVLALVALSLTTWRWSGARLSSWWNNVRWTEAHAPEYWCHSDTRYCQLHNCRHSRCQRRCPGRWCKAWVCCLGRWRLSAERNEQKCSAVLM
jgi:hypothetical protein